MIMLFIPLIIILVSIFNWKLLKIYYASGHPWARIYKEFPCNAKTTTDDEEKGGEKVNSEAI